MRHRVHGRKLGRTSAHRKALFRNQLTALFTHERIITTVAKAKELRPIAERMVTIARTGTLSARRKVATMVPDKEIARRLFEEIAPRFADRPGGYTRIMRLGRRRGDNAELAIIEFIDYDLADHVDSGDEGDGKGSFMDRAKGVFGGGAAAEAADAAADESAEALADEVADEVADEPVEAAAEVDEPAAEATAEETTDPETEEVVEEAADEPVEAAPVEDAAAEDAETETAEASDEAADPAEEKQDD